MKLIFVFWWLSAIYTGFPSLYKDHLQNLIYDLFHWIKSKILETIYNLYQYQTTHFDMTSLVTFSKFNKFACERKYLSIFAIYFLLAVYTTNRHFNRWYRQVCILNLCIPVKNLVSFGNSEKEKLWNNLEI